MFLFVLVGLICFVGKHEWSKTRFCTNKLNADFLIMRENILCRKWEKIYYADNILKNVSFRSRIMGRRRFHAAVPFLFVRLQLYTWRLFCYYLFPISPSLVPREGCTSLLWHFLGIFTYIFFFFFFFFGVPFKISPEETVCIKCYIMKTRLYNLTPLKLGFTWVYIIFRILLKNIECGYSFEPPQRGGSNEYQQSMFWTGI